MLRLSLVLQQQPAFSNKNIKTSGGRKWQVIVVWKIVLGDGSVFPPCHHP
jgi:hypothetical protein